MRGIVHSNTIENVFSVFKRGMKGIYQHCGEGHLHRYLAEFDFRYNAALPLASRTTSVTTCCLRPFAASASPIGGLVKPVSPKQKIKRLKRIAKKLKEKPPHG